MNQYYLIAHGKLKDALFELQRIADGAEPLDSYNPEAVDAVISRLMNARVEMQQAQFFDRHLEDIRKMEAMRDYMMDRAWKPGVPGKSHWDNFISLNPEYKA